MLAVAVIDQGVEPGYGFRHHVAAAAAVAAPGAAELDEFLAPECHAAVAAVTGADLDLGLVEKFHAASSLPPPNPGVPGFGHLSIGPSRKHPTWTSGGGWRGVNR